jgi:hypothetical protein
MQPRRRNVLSIAKDAKTIKGQSIGFLTGILYLAPHTLAGRENTCPMAEVAGCLKGCLNTAGRGVFNSVQQARIAKTQRFFDERNEFMQDLAFSIRKVIRKASKLGLTPLIRLNGTSDIRFENVGLTLDGLEYPNIFAAFPNVQFYDYTKIPNRKNIPSNYDLTFSYSGVEGYEKHVQKARLNSSLSRIAVVFDKSENIPSEFIGLPTVSGDNTDVRHLDPHNSIVALYAKGQARKDFSGFVVRA